MMGVAPHGDDLITIQKSTLTSSDSFKEYQLSHIDVLHFCFSVLDQFQ